MRLVFCTPIFGIRKIKQLPAGSKCKTLVVLGSGGHTAEMLALMKNLDCKRYTPLHLVLADTDKTSRPKIENIKDFQWAKDEKVYHTIKRSREVGQSWLTTVFTTLISTMHSILLVPKLSPNLVLCNGPGTCIPICIGALVTRMLFLGDPTIVFVESFCRVQSLSLSGKLLYPFVDKFIVQWPELATSDRPKCQYLGNLF